MNDADERARVQRAMSAALVALARHNVPADVQQLLTQGSLMQAIPPGALAAAIGAGLNAGFEDLDRASREALSNLRRRARILLITSGLAALFAVLNLLLVAWRGLL